MRCASSKISPRWLSGSATRNPSPMRSVSESVGLDLRCADSREAFEAKRREAETALANIDDAYLHNFYLPMSAWDEMSRGRISEARAGRRALTAIGTVDERTEIARLRACDEGVARLAQPTITRWRSRGGASAIDVVPGAVREGDRGLDAKYAALVLLNRPGAVERSQRLHRQVRGERVDACSSRARRRSSGVCVGARTGRIDEGLRHIEDAIARREKEGYRASADWCRMFLCEIYLEILSGKGEGIARRAPAQHPLVAAGRHVWRQANRVVASRQVRANPQFDREGYYFARTEMILGLLYKAQEKQGACGAPSHRGAAHPRRVRPLALVDRVEAALGSDRRAERRSPATLSSVSAADRRSRAGSAGTCRRRPASSRSAGSRAGESRPPFFSLRSNQLVSGAFAPISGSLVPVMSGSCSPRLSQSYMTASNCAPRLAPMKLPRSPRSADRRDGRGRNRGRRTMPRRTSRRVRLAIALHDRAAARVDAPRYARLRGRRDGARSRNW